MKVVGLEELASIAAAKIADINFDKTDFYAIFLSCLALYCIRLYLPHRQTMKRLKLEHEAKIAELKLALHGRKKRKLSKKQR